MSHPTRYNLESMYIELTVAMLEHPVHVGDCCHWPTRAQAQKMWLSHQCKVEDIPDYDFQQALKEVLVLLLLFCTDITYIFLYTMFQKHVTVINNIYYAWLIIFVCYGTCTLLFIFTSTWMTVATQILRNSLTSWTLLISSNMSSNQHTVMATHLIYLLHTSWKHLLKMSQWLIYLYLTTQPYWPG